MCLEAITEGKCPDSAPVTPESANEDCPVFLIHDFACEDIEGWLEQCYLYLFEEVLEQWCLPDMESPLQCSAKNQV